MSLVPVRSFALAAVLMAAPAAAGTSSVTGTFVVNGKDAGLTHVRAARVILDAEGRKGVAVLLSARPAEGDFAPWRSGEPAERGSFIYVIFEPDGAIWIAELGHGAAASRFGVITEVKVVAYEVKGDHITAHIRTEREESFSDDVYTLDLSFEADVEAP